MAEGDEPAESVEVGKLFLQRFPKAEPLVQGRVRRLMADCAVRTGKDNLDEAVANYEAALVKETPPTEKVDVLSRLIYLVGVKSSSRRRRRRSSPRRRRPPSPPRWMRTRWKICKRPIAGR